MMKNNKKKGFTIVELVIVIAVIAILAAVLIPTFSGVVTKANKSKAMQEAKSAWTNYLADQLEANPNLVMDDLDYVIQSGNYYFTVENGQMSTTAADSGTATLKVQNGTLVAAP